MKDQKSKNTNILPRTDDSRSSNQNANPRHMNPELAAMLAQEQHPHKESKMHEPERDKRAAAREIHTNGSTRKGDL